MERTNNYLYSINEYVSYRHNGIYQIIDICEKEFQINKSKTYYVLQSVYDSNSKIYVPVDAKDTKTMMKRILTVDEINSIISKTEELECTWIDDSSQRDFKLNGILDSGNREDILWIVKLLSIQKEKLSQQKKKLYSCDEKILTTAERIITEEFAFTLGIPKSEVIQYIVSNK